MIAVHDPDVVLTDLGLAALGGYLAWRLARHDARGAVIMAGLASAALFGAVFHAFFPDKTSTPAGFVAWLPVAFSILVVATTLLSLALLVLAPRLPARTRGVVLGSYALAFVVVILFIDETFSTIVAFYGPAVVVLLAASIVEALRTSSREWALVAAGLALSGVAALLQQAGVAIHPEYFDHNAVYHVVQAAALVCLYLGFRGRRAAPADRR